jgi:hypothetical protein
MRGIVRIAAVLFMFIGMGVLIAGQPTAEGSSTHPGYAQTNVALSFFGTMARPSLNGPSA